MKKLFVLFCFCFACSEPTTPGTDDNNNTNSDVTDSGSPNTDSESETGDTESRDSNTTESTEDTQSATNDTQSVTEDTVTSSGSATNTATADTETSETDTGECISGVVCSEDKTQLMKCNKTNHWEVKETCEITELCLPFDGNGPKCQCNKDYKFYYCKNDNTSVGVEDGCGNKDTFANCYNHSCVNAVCTEEPDTGTLDTDTQEDTEPNYVCDPPANEEWCECIYFPPSMLTGVKCYKGKVGGVWNPVRLFLCNPGVTYCAMTPDYNDPCNVTCVPS
jgi:hypothetical protein